MVEKLKYGRGKWEIIYDIFRAIADDGKAKKTNIMHKAYLDSRSMHTYFDLLVDKGFIEKCNPDINSYELSDKGEDLYKNLKNVEEIVRELK